MSELTLGKAKEMVGEILLSDREAYFGLDSYPCTYFHGDDTPCCVVGHVFSRIGIARKDLVSNNEFADANSIILTAISVTWAGKISSPAAKFLEQIQDLQDEGQTWGEIYDYVYGEANE